MNTGTLGETKGLLIVSNSLAKGGLIEEPIVAYYVLIPVSSL